MKKIICLVLLSCILLITSCGVDTTPDPQDTTSSSTTQAMTFEDPAPVTQDPSSTQTTESSTTVTTVPEPDTQDTPSTTAPESSTPETSTSATTDPVVVSNNKLKFSNALKTLLDFYKWNPEDVIPNALRPESQSKLTNTSSLVTNYYNFVSTSSLPQNGIGEQWNMVVENIEESQAFFNILYAIDGVATSSVIAFNNYLDKNPEETAHHEFETGVYSVTINCTENQIYYVLNYSTNLPVFGAQDIQIALSMNTNTQVKQARIQIGDANSLLYTVDRNTYSFAIKYLNLKYSYFEITKNADNSFTGHIYEYLKASSIEIPNSADFYINNEYVTVVGNKADGLIGFSGTICELYSTQTGKMLCYEVKESIEGITYNTMWFNLYDIGGISSIKYTPSTDNQKAAFSLNNSSSAWQPKNYGLSGGLKMLSRRFDLEFRTQYFYYYDAQAEKYIKTSVEIPMLFVQEEVYSDLIKDVKSTNDITIQINLDNKHIQKLNNEYSSKINIYEKNENTYTVDYINKYIGNKVTFN